jgi:hypothetical protein
LVVLYEKYSIIKATPLIFLKGEVMPRGIPKKTTSQDVETKQSNTPSNYILLPALSDDDVTVSAINIKADFNKSGVMMKTKTENSTKVEFIQGVVVKVRGEIATLTTA